MTTPTDKNPLNTQRIEEFAQAIVIRCVGSCDEDEMLQRARQLAKRIAAAGAAAGAAEERERCAKIVEAAGPTPNPIDLAAAIREDRR